MELKPLVNRVAASSLETSIQRINPKRKGF